MSNIPLGWKLHCRTWISFGLNARFEGHIFSQVCLRLAFWWTLWLFETCFFASSLFDKQFVFLLHHFLTNHLGSVDNSENGSLINCFILYHIGVTFKHQPNFCIKKTWNFQITPDPDSVRLTWPPVTCNLNCLILSHWWNLSLTINPTCHLCIKKNLKFSDLPKIIKLLSF